MLWQCFDVSAREIVLDAGPIRYDAIQLQGDPDLEHGLRQEGLEPMETQFRLIEIPLDAIGEVRVMPRWHHVDQSYHQAVEALRTGAEFPPIVVMAARTGWLLVDGVHRAYAHWVLGRTTIKAYDLIEPRRLLA